MTLVLYQARWVGNEECHTSANPIGKLLSSGDVVKVVQWTEAGIKNSRKAFAADSLSWTQSCMFLLEMPAFAVDRLRKNVKKLQG